MTTLLSTILISFLRSTGKIFSLSTSYLSTSDTKLFKLVKTLFSSDFDTHLERSNSTFSCPPK